MRKLKTEECGKKSILLQNREEGYLLGMVLHCKNFDCEICGAVIQNFLVHEINYYADKFMLDKFFTLSPGVTDITELNKIQTKLMDSLAETEEENFKQSRLRKDKTKLTDEKLTEAYQKRIDYLFGKEHFYRWFYGYDLTDEEKNKNYVPLSNIGLKITDVILLTKKEIMDFLKGYLEKRQGKKVRKDVLEKFYNESVKESQKKWKKWINALPVENDGKKRPFKQLKLRGKRQEFIKDFDSLIQLMAHVQYHESFTAEEIAEKKEYYLNKKPEKGQEFAWLSLPEFHKVSGNRLHRHGLTNYYIPIQLFKDVIGDVVYDMQEIRDLEGKGSLHVAKYVVKYVTKDTLTIYQKEKEKGNERFQIITSSNNISISIDDAFEIGEKGKFIPLGQPVNGILPSKSKRYLTKEQFQKDVIEKLTVEHPNKWIQKAIEAFIDHWKSLKATKLSGDALKLKREILKEKEEEYLTKALQEEIDRLGTSGAAEIKLTKQLKREGLTDKQFEAVKGIIKSEARFNYLVGYAGTGKTHTLTHLLKFIDTEKQNVAVVSLTAQATQRVNGMMVKNGIKNNDIPVSTIHKLCGAQFTLYDYPVFYNDWNKQLDIDILIIDEFSMIDRRVLVALLAGLKPTTKIIMIGDPAQLNPVHSKNPLFYLKQMGILFAKWELSQVIRSGDKITDIATEIRKGEFDNVSFELMDLATEEALEEIKKEKEKGYHVLTNTVALKSTINKYIQKDKKDITLNYNYSIGDTVMLTRNAPNGKYFNGETAEIIAFDDEKTTFRKNDDTEFELNRSQMFNQVEPSHAMTIHKSQGSEFEKVLIVLDVTKTNVLNRNLIYTAVTRAKTDYKIIVTKEKTDKIINQMKTIQ